MSTSLPDSLKDLTPEGLYAEFIEIAKGVGLSTTAWQSGEPMGAFVSIFCRWLVVPWNSKILPALRAPFLDWASGAWLTILAWVGYRVLRKRATFGTVDLVVENREGGFWTVNPEDIRWINENGKTFKNVSGGTLPSWSGSGPFPTLTLSFVADEAGSDSATDAGGVPAYPTPPLQAPGSGIYLRTNDNAISAQDEEEDDPLKERCRLSTGPLSPAGPKAAYVFVALSTRRPDGTDPARLLATEDGDVAVNVTRAIQLSPTPGAINLWLASPDGPASGDTSTEGSDVYLVNQAAQTLCVPAGGFTCTTAAAPAHAFATTLTLLVDKASGITAADAEATARTAVLEFFKRFPLGGRVVAGQHYIVIEEITKVAGVASPGIYKVTSSVSADVPIAENAVVVPTINVHAILVTQ